MYFDLCSLKNGCFDLNQFFYQMFLGTLNLVKVALGLPWDSKILDRMYWQLRGDIQVINPILTCWGCILTLIKLT